MPNHTMPVYGITEEWVGPNKENHYENSCHVRRLRWLFPGLQQLWNHVRAVSWWKSFIEETAGSLPAPPLMVQGPPGGAGFPGALCALWRLPSWDSKGGYVACRPPALQYNYIIMVASTCMFPDIATRSVWHLWEEMDNDCQSCIQCTN